MSTIYSIVDQYVERECVQMPNLTDSTSSIDNISPYIGDMITINGIKHILTLDLIKTILQVLRCPSNVNEWLAYIINIKYLHSRLGDDNKIELWNIFDDWCRTGENYNRDTNYKQWKSINNKYGNFKFIIAQYAHHMKYQENVIMTYSYYDNITSPTTMEIINNYIKQVFCFIENSGKSFWLIKGIKDDEVFYERINCCTSKENIFKSIRWTLVNRGDTITLYNALYKYRKNISYDYVDFKPNINNCKMFNLFTGYKNVRLLQFDVGQFEMIQKHIFDIWANQDDTVYNYIVNWFAHLVQYPNERMDIALIIKSEQGAGKNIIIDFIGNKVIGSKYYMYITQMDDLFKRFNSQFMNKLLTCVDEIKSSDITKNNICDKLEACITRTKLNVEKKGVDIISVSDYNNYIFLTNRDIPLLINRDDWQFFAIDCNNSKIGDTEYFTKLVKSMTDTAAQHMYSWLMSIDVSKFDAKNRPTNAVYNNIKLECLSQPIEFIVSFLRNQIDDFSVPEDGHLCITVKALYEHFDELYKPHKYNQISFGRTLSCIHSSTRKRIGNKTFNVWDVSIQELQDSVKRYLKMPNLMT